MRRCTRAEYKRAQHFVSLARQQDCLLCGQMDVLSISSQHHRHCLHLVYDLSLGILVSVRGSLNAQVSRFGLAVDVAAPQLIYIFFSFSNLCFTGHFFSLIAMDDKLQHTWWIHMKGSMLMQLYLSRGKDHSPSQNQGLMLLATGGCSKSCTLGTQRDQTRVLVGCSANCWQVGLSLYCALHLDLTWSEVANVKKGFSIGRAHRIW